MSASPSLVDRLRRADWFDRERLRAYSIILCIGECIALVFVVGHGFTVAGTLGLSDFLGFYAAADLADAGPFAAAYDYPRHAALEHGLVPDLDGYVAFFYPPVFLLLLLPLGLLSYTRAYLVWSALKVLAFMAGIGTILRAPERLWPFLALPALFLDLWAGQNGLLTAALFAGATACVDRRPILSGLLFGMICYKPHFGLLIPVALVAGGHWRAVAGATVTAVGLSLLSWAVLGTETWHAFFQLFSLAPGTFTSGGVSYELMASPFSVVRALGGGVPGAAVVQGLATLAAATAVAIVWRRGGSLPARAIILIAGTLVAVPLVLYYDLALTGVILAWVWAGHDGIPWREWEKLELAILYFAPPVLKTLGASSALPEEFLATLAFFLFAIRYARRDAAFAPLPLEA